MCAGSGARLNIQRFDTLLTRMSGWGDILLLLMIGPIQLWATDRCHNSMPSRSHLTFNQMINYWTSVSSRIFSKIKSRIFVKVNYFVFGQMFVFWFVWPKNKSSVSKPILLSHIVLYNNTCKWLKSGLKPRFLIPDATALTMYKGSSCS